MKNYIKHAGQWAGFLAGMFLVAPAVQGAEPAIKLPLPPADRVVLPASVPDPIEPFNRVMWGFNEGVLIGVIEPTSRVYRFVIVKPVRTGIGNFGRNLTYPGRLINNLLQEKWRGARDETRGFLVNSTVGVLGFFDAGKRWQIPRSDADFGQTFGQWGWRPGCFIMLPFFGPSNERDTVGLAADTAANPLLYISPYKLVGSDPLTYLGPYSYFTYAVMYNGLSDTVDETVRFAEAEADPYSEAALRRCRAWRRQLTAPRPACGPSRRRACCRRASARTARTRGRPASTTARSPRRRRPARHSPRASALPSTPATSSRF